MKVFPRGLPTRGARPVEQVTLAEALSRRWDDDRHIVLYTSDTPYRINNPALGTVGVEVRLLALDMDNHSDTPGWMRGERAKIAALLAEHPGGFVHTTKRGWRAIYALPAPFPMRSAADKEGFALFYARVVREGHAFDAEILGADVHALGAFELPAHAASKPDLRQLAAVLPGWGGIAKRWQPKREAFRVVASAAFDHVHDALTQSTDYATWPLEPLVERRRTGESVTVPKAAAVAGTCGTCHTHTLP